MSTHTADPFQVEGRLLAGHHLMPQGVWITNQSTEKPGVPKTKIGISGNDSGYYRESTLSHKVQDPEDQVPNLRNDQDAAHL